MNYTKSAFSAVTSTAGVIFFFVEILLLLRFALKLFGANAANSFVNWIYETSWPLLSMFAGIFPSPKLEGAYVLEFNTIFALLIYSILYFLFVKVLELLYEMGTKALPSGNTARNK